MITKISQVKSFKNALCKFKTLQVGMNRLIIQDHS